MRKTLIIVTKPNERLCDAVVENQLALSGHEIKIIDITEKEPDYRALLGDIFAASSVQVW